MNKILIVIFSLAATQLYSQKIKILGTEIDQSQICAELGDAKTCNPCPFGFNRILNDRRWALAGPINNDKDNLANSNDYIITLAKKYIGGFYADDTTPTPASDEVKQLNLYEEGFIDVSSNDIIISIKDSIIKNIDVKVKVDNIIGKLTNKFGTSLDSNTISTTKEEVSNFYSNIRNKGIGLNLKYHSVRLNGKFLNKVRDETSGTWFNLTNPFSKKIENINLNKMSFRPIWGMGIIEYDISINETLEKELSLSLPELVSEYVTSTIKKDLNRQINLTVPSRFDLVLVSTPHKVK